MPFSKVSISIKFIILIFTFSAISCASIAQSTKDQLTIKEKKIFDEAKKYAQQGNFKKSNERFSKLLTLKSDFTEGYLRLASNHFQQKSFQKSEELFLKAIEISPDFDVEMYYSLAMVQKELGKQITAAENLDIYIQKQQNNPEKVHKATKQRDNLRFSAFAYKHPVPFKPISIGENINSQNSEYFPMIALDGSKIIFTRNVKKPSDFIGQEDFFMSDLKDSIWQKAYPVTDLNTHQNEGAFAIAANGKYIVFTACDRKEAFGSCDLYYSMLVDGQWTNPVNMGNKVNSAAWDSQPTLSADGRTLLFSSRRLGTLGGSDIFMTYRDQKNAWVTPINLGPMINTIGDDESPFLHPDGMTLYFRSNGRPGLGNFDIYYSRMNDTTKMWQTPINIGYPINTEGEEGSLVVSLDGKTAYFASDNNNVTGQKMNHLDIFYFELYEQARPLPTTFVKGLVTDAITGKTLSAKITIRDLSTGKNVFQLQTESDGYFLSGITLGNNYACIIENKNYSYQSINFDLTNQTKLAEPYYLDIKLNPLTNNENKINDTKILQNIFFASGSAELLPTSSHEIALIHEMLVENPTMKIKIIGHTDDIGQADDNLLLSERRASAVANAIIAKGIDPIRILSEGKGETTPIATNETEEGRRKNRRTEMIISF